jgi:hypothetical protein
MAIKVGSKGHEWQQTDRPRYFRQARLQPSRPHRAAGRGVGDTPAGIATFDTADNVGYISTSGGTFLKFLAARTLPAIAVLEERAAE